MDNNSIKKNIMNIRKSRKLTQEEMAHKLGISLTAYRDLEKGSTNVMNSNVIKMAHLLDTSTEELILGYKPAQTEGYTLEDIRQEYGAKITNLQRRIDDLEKLLSSQEENIKSKNEIISMLKKRLGEEN